jgi:predicted RNase H-like nuclease (RuvC/YqgF family)
MSVGFHRRVENANIDTLRGVKIVPGLQRIRELERRIRQRDRRIEQLERQLDELHASIWPQRPRGPSYRRYRGAA